MVGRIGPPASRRHDPIEVLPQVRVHRREGMHCYGASLEIEVKQFLAECRNTKRTACVAQLNAQPGSRLQPRSQGRDRGQFIRWEPPSSGVEMPTPDYDAH